MESIRQLSRIYIPASCGDGLARIERREWLLWGAAATITLLLTAGIASFLFPLLHERAAGEAVTLREEVLGLFAVVMLFDFYIVYQQLQFHAMRRRLLASEEIFRLISENAADLIAVVDRENRRIYTSASHARVLGYEPAELDAATAFTEVHPEDLARVEASAAATLATGGERILEYRARHKDGRWRVLESTLSVIGATGGATGRLVIVSRDVTENRETLDALRRSEASFRSLVQEAPYGICRADESGRLIEVNPALVSMLGYEEAADVVGLNMETGIFKQAEDFRRLRELLVARDFRGSEWEWKKADGSFITVRCGGRRPQEKADASAGMEIFAEDVTEKRLLERQLRMAGKMEAIGRLSGGIAHDFNNLLGVIIGYSQLMRRHLAPDREQLRDFAQQIEDAGQRAASLTRQLLAFSRQQILSPTTLDLNVLVRDMEKMLPRLLGEDIEIHLNLSSHLGTVLADRSQVEQIIMNLAINARDAMPTGGALRIATANAEFDEEYVRHHDGARRGSYVMLSVEDTGFGMSAETLTHIFEPFFTTKEVGKGTGLGLATVYGVVKQSEGYIWVKSQPGEGSCFEVFLPRAKEGRPEVPSLASSPAVVPHGFETILVVEDAEPLRKLVKSILELQGYRVVSAENAEQAIRMSAEGAMRFDLLLTDVVMPGMNGKVLVDRLTAKCPDIGVLYMSGYADSFVAGHGVLEPGTSLMHKPFNEGTLLAKVREVLDLRAARTGVHTGRVEVVQSSRRRDGKDSDC